MLTKRQIKNLALQGFDVEWIDEVMPQGGLKFNEDLIVGSDGYYSCLHVYKLPNMVPKFWLKQIVDNSSSITKIDIATLDKDKILRQTERSIRELTDQAKNGRSSIDRMSASDDRKALLNFASSINKGGEVLKVIDMRIYVTSDTKEKLRSKLADMRKTYRGLGYDTAVYVGSQKEEFDVLSTNYNDYRSKSTLRDSGIITTRILGGGYPFDHQSLIDPHGGYIGDTASDGAFLFDPFHKDALRKSFSTMVLGKSGFGKSTLLKMIADMMAGRNCFIRGFEINRDWRKWIEAKNGKILDLSGLQGMLNPLEPLATFFDEETNTVQHLESYQQHRAQFFTLVQFINPDFRNLDIKILNNIFDDFYIDYGLLPRNYQDKSLKLNIIGRKPTEYPTVKEFYQYLVKRLENNSLNISNAKEQQAIDDFKLVLHDMAISNGNIFNGHTTLKNLDSEDILFFDLQSIDGFDPSIKACLLFQSITIVWQQALNNGLKQKILKEKGQIKEEDTKYFLFFLDECQNILKPEYGFAVKYINKFVREMRKFSAGIYFATQSPQELLPENSDNEYTTAIKTIFELCNNRILLHQDESVKPLLKQTLGSSLKDSDYDILSKLKEGQALFYLGGGQNYRVNVRPDNYQLEVFAGGI